ncbi:unnamed protein product [Microthlaspi erraticum]|uniref:Uncharacterized protein n=2 Tax=Microthlaspi erraticum TaxID=1685480 RepID=A0A6D2J9B2_9BRAS|nr:unnamed protein product [Microthlaspi erraticum]
MSNLILLSESRTSIQGGFPKLQTQTPRACNPASPAMRLAQHNICNHMHIDAIVLRLTVPQSNKNRRLGALATFSAHACEGSRSSGITQKLDERLHPGTTVHRGTRFILPSIGLTGAPCQCLVGSHIVIWYHTRPRQLTRLSSESSSLHAQPPRCQSGWALTCENALDYTFLDNMWLDTPHVLST